ncbi:MAG TPA: hypothetical protein VGK96_25315, partial [Candidatus Sulfotelmatobacter sp.]
KHEFLGAVSLRQAAFTSLMSLFDLASAEVPRTANATEINSRLGDFIFTPCIKSVHLLIEVDHVPLSLKIRKMLYEGCRRLTAISAIRQMRSFTWISPKKPKCQRHNVGWPKFNAFFLTVASHDISHFRDHGRGDAEKPNGDQAGREHGLTSPVGDDLTSSSRSQGSDCYKGGSPERLIMT